MDEVQRFLRYVLPGLVFVIELFIFFCISDKLCTVYWVVKHGGAGPAVGLFLGSRAIGFILANIYHSFYGRWRPFATDHRCLFPETPPGFRAVNLSGHSVYNLTKREAWTIIAQYCHSQMKLSSGKDIQGMALIADRLVTIGHAIGTTVIGTFLSIFTWGFMQSYVFGRSLCSINSAARYSILFVWVLILVFLLISYCRTIKALERIVNSTLARRLRRRPHFLIDICFIKN